MNATASAAPAAPSVTAKILKFPRWKVKVFRTPSHIPPLDALVSTGSKTVLLEQLIPDDFPAAGNIRVNPQFLAAHPQRELLQKPILTLDDIRRLQEPFLNQGICGVGNTIPAAYRPSHPIAAKAYEKHQWIRDSVVALEAMINAGEYVKASACLEEILVFLSHPNQRQRIVQYHFPSSCGGTAHDRYHHDKADRAFIRAPISRNGHLGENLHDRNGHKIEDGAEWAHDQLGSFGQLIRLACLAHRNNKIDLRAIYGRVIERVAAQTNDPEISRRLKGEHILVSLQKFLYLVSIVDAHSAADEHESDLPRTELSFITRGTWEETPAKNRLSEMVPLLAGVHEFMRLYDREPGTLLLAGDTAHRRDFINQLKTFKGLLQSQIDIQVPNLPNRLARESFSLNGRDSVVVLSLSPRLINFTALQQFAMIRTVLRNMGIANEYGILDAPGIIRYRNDHYTAGDMHELADINWNVHAPKTLANWTIFDSPIGANFFMRACELAQYKDATPQHFALGKQHYEYGCRFLQRSTSQVPTEAYKGKMRFGDTGRFHKMFYAPYDSPEAFYFNSKTGKWEPNTNCLTWTVAQRAMIFHWAQRAGEIYGKN